jgi:hypothetical protein
VADGICPATIGVKRKGETDPLVPTGDGVREPQKRRMEIVFPQGTSPSTTNCRSRRASRRGFIFTDSAMGIGAPLACRDTESKSPTTDLMNAVLEYATTRLSRRLGIVAKLRSAPPAVARS